MAQKGDRIPCVVFEDGSVELFHSFERAREFADSYLKQCAKTVTSVESFGPNCKSVTFLTHDNCESFLTIHFKVVG